MNPYENSHTYRTGSTNPPKSHRGLITLLLIMVILLITAVVILSMMNVRLFRLLEEQDTHSVEFSEISPASYEEPVGLEASDFGLTIQEIAQLYRSYNEWPQGVYISHVQPDGPAANSDLRPGDIVVALNGIPVSGSEDFIQQLENLDDTIEFTVFRDSQEMVISLNAEE